MNRRRSRSFLPTFSSKTLTPSQMSQITHLTVVLLYHEVTFVALKIVSYDRNLLLGISNLLVVVVVLLLVAVLSIEHSVQPGHEPSDIVGTVPVLQISRVCTRT